MQRNPATMAILALLALSAPAHADEKIIQVMTVQNPNEEAMLRQLSPEDRAVAAQSGIGKPVITAYYAGAGHIRWDYGAISVLVDTRTGKATTVNRQTHLYSVRPLAPASAGANAGAVAVKKTGKSKSILGHRANEYVVSLSGGITGAVTGDIWAAPDLPQPKAGMGGGPSAMRSALSKISGMPLSMTIHSATQMGDVTITSSARSISVRPLPASTFAIPAGYKPAPAGAGVGAGMPPGFGGG